MYSVKVNDVNQALQFGLEHLLHAGIEETSRNGPVLVAPEPVCIEYINPRARVLFSPTRDANPWFHLFESLWMLAGDNAIEFPCYFNSKYNEFSDDGRTMWDAYGWRWRRFFGWDQLSAIADELKRDPSSRRCVLSMWNSMDTLNTHDDFYVATHGGKAVPCNTHAYFAIRAGRLNLTVMNRSNDLVWGLAGANAVHMSFLLEYMSALTSIPMGVYYQFTNNLHLYTAKFSREWCEQVIAECIALEDMDTPELGPAIEPGFDEDLARFMPWARGVIQGGTQSPLGELRTPFVREVAVPMFLAWTLRKAGNTRDALDILEDCAAPDWALTATEWIERREK